MKKLMVMLGAAATAFGLYAADATFATSFETGDAGVDGTTFTPVTAGWSGLAETVTLSTYDGDAYTYGSGAFARRDGMFKAESDNNNYLSLETGKDTVTHAAGDVYLDQLVKFTGFEEEATVADGTKIAVWLSAIEEDGYVPAVINEDGEEVTPASGVQGATNLYVTAAKVHTDGGIKVEKVNFAIPAPAGQEWKTDKWYRLTIKNIGDIYDATAKESDVSRAGFIVYVDGIQVGCEAAKGCIEYASEMTTEAKGYMAQGQLFAAIDTTDVAFATVGYQGIGAIDDIIVDQDGPEYCQTVAVTVAPINGAVITVTDKDGQVVELAGGVYTLKPGAYKVTYTADKGYILTPVEKNYNTATTTEVDDSAEVNPVEGVAMITDDESGEDTYYATLADAFAAATEDQTVVLVKNIELGATDNPITVPATFKGSLNLSNCSIIRTANANSGISYVLDIPNGADLTITDKKNGTGLIKATPIASGNLTYPASLIRVKGKLTLSRGTLQSDYCCVKVDEDPGVGEFIMEGGKLEVLANETAYAGLTFAVMVWGDAEINGGELIGNVQVLECNDNNVSKAGQLQINDGTFDPKKVFLVAYDAEPVVMPYAEIANEVAADFAGEYVDFGAGEGLKVKTTVGDEYTTITLEAKTYVCEINGKGYETLDAAFEAATDGDEIELLANVELTDAISIANKNVTLSGEFTVSAAGRVFDVRNGATLTIAAETTVLGTGNGGNDTPIFLWPYSFESRKLTDADAANYAKAKLVVNGTVKYTGTAGVAAITQNGNDQIAGSDGVDIVINGTVINTTDAAIYAPGKGTITVNDGAYIEGIWAGIQMKSGALTVNGGTIKCTGVDSTPTTIFNNGANASGCAIQMEGNTGYAGAMTLTVNGGTIESVNAKAVYAYGEASQLTSITINDGILKGKEAVFQFDDDLVVVPGTSKALFSHDVSDYCETGFETVLDTESNLYKVVPAAPAEITVTVKKTADIASVTYDGKAIEFNDNVATLSLPADTTAVTLTLAAVDTIKIPVFTFAKGADVVGWSATGKETSYDVAADDTLNFAAEEANVQDPAITDEVAADAVADAATTVEAKAKVAAITTGEGAVGGKALANWINTKASGAVDAALAGDYVKASIALDVAPITEATEIEIKDLSTGAAGAMTFEVDINDVAAVEAIKDMVEASSDLGAWDDHKLETTATYDAGKVTITPKAATDKAFMKVVIPQDAK